MGCEVEICRGTVSDMSKIATNERDRQSLLYHFTASAGYFRALAQRYKQTSEIGKVYFDISQRVPKIFERYFKDNKKHQKNRTK